MRKFFLSALVFVFNIVFGLALLTFTLRTTFLTPSFYKNVFSQSKFYEQGFYQFVDSLLTENLSQNEGLPLTTGDIKKTLLEIVSPSYLRIETERLVDEVFAFMFFKNEKPNLVLDVRDLKSKSKVALGEMMKNKLESLPTCSLEQMKRLQNLAEGQIPACKPPGVDLSKMDLGKEMGQLVDSMPDKIDLLTIGSSGGERPVDVMVQMRSSREKINILMLLDKILLAVMVVNLVLIFLIASPMRARLRWVGWTLVSASFLPLVLSVGGIFLGKGVVEGQVVNSLRGVPTAVVESVVLGVSKVSADILQQVLLFSLVSFGVGVVFLLAVLFFHSEKAVPAEKTQISS